MDDPAQPEPRPRKPIDKVAVGLGVALVALVAATLYFTPKFVAEERQRDLRTWQIRLGIVADSRTTAVNEWAKENFSVLHELAENASLQLYMTELTLKEGEQPPSAEVEAESGYLQNLLMATADRAGFTPPAPGWDVRANVKRVGVTGIALVDTNYRPVVSTPGMPPPTEHIRAAIKKSFGGEPALVDLYMGASNLPTMAFVLPVFAVHGQEGPGAKVIGAVVGLRVVGQDLFGRLKQPGEVAKTAETYLVRSTGTTVEYLSSLADGTPPLTRALARDTPDLAAAYALDKPGGFATKRDYAGEEVLVTSRLLARLPWVLVRKVSLAEAMAETETWLKTIFSMFTLAVLVITVAVVAVWRHGIATRAREVSEKFRAAAERYENLSRFLRLVTDSQPTIIAAVDRDDRYTFANATAAKEAGMDVEDMPGKSLADVLGPVKAKAFNEINRRVLAESRPESHTHAFGENAEERVIKSDHMPLRGSGDRPEGVLMVLEDITELTRERRRRERMLRNLVATLVGVVDRRDPFSAHHSQRVAEVSRCIAEEMGVPEQEVRTVETAGNLISLGKIFIPAEVLTKTGDLTDEERELLAGSYRVSGDLLQDVEFEGPVVETIHQMGETWDGSGPLGRKGEDILRTARILAVANAFVSMTSPRAYRGALGFEEVSKTLLEESGVKYDRKAVFALINYLDNRGGAERWASFRDAPPETPS